MPSVEAGSGAKVLIAGGGIAGLEALMALRDLARDRAQLTLLAPRPEFVYRPWLVEEPFTPAPADRRELAPLAADFRATFVEKALAGVRASDRVIELDDGSELPYEYAVICVGARISAPFESAHTLALGPEPLPMNDLLRKAAAHPSRRILLVVPPRVSWPLPIYEVAMMAERRARELGLELEVEVITPESAPLIVFGRIPSDAVVELLRARRITLRTSTHAAEDDGRIVLVPDGEPVEAGAVVALPVLDGPGIEGLPADDGGFIPIDDHARVQGVKGVYAAGDGTNFPIKQGGIGTQQADAAAEDIAASLGVDIEPEPFHPVLRGKLLVGEESLSLKADLAGGGGEGAASLDYLWWPPQKVGGRYLAPYLEGDLAHRYPDAPRHSIDVEVAFPTGWHEEPMALDPLAPIDHE